MKRSVVILLVLGLAWCLVPPAGAADSLNCWFPPAWKAKTGQARIITSALTEKTGITIQPRIADSYPQILSAFASDEPSLVYVGSFVQAIINARELGTPLAQNVNGKEFYAGIMVFPKGQKPEAILQEYPTQVAFAVGASSGESAAKAATKGLAAIPTASHAASCAAIQEGRAKAAFVKNWWWEANGSKYPALVAAEIPGVSIRKNPDNVLTASRAVSPELKKKIQAAAITSSSAFGNGKMMPFSAREIAFSLELMRKAGINPLTYTW